MDGNADLLADSQIIVNRWKNFSQILNVHKQIEVRTAEPLVPARSPYDVETIVCCKFEKNKSPDNDEIPEEVIQAGGKILRSEIHKLIDSI
jgi:hypothetical protein